MKKLLKKSGVVITVFISVLSAVLITGCGKAKESETGESFGGLPEITVGVDSYPPFDYVSADGKPTGIDVDLATEAFHRMGYQPEFLTIDWEKKKELLENGDIDCIWCSFTMNGREDQYKWAGPYMISNQVVAVLPGSAIYTLPDLKDKNIAVQTTTKPEEIFLSHEDSRIPQLRGLISLQNRELIYTSLDKGYVDAIAAHETSILQYMKDYDKEYRILEEPLETVGLGAAFALSDTRGLDRELSGITRDIIGKYLENADKYLEVDRLEK